ncbi:hypothetical protein KFE98_01185 [bacterium SCSIO 12741]|nr:hypothetical protein KFE98_01185 [bacterium SCSIO 12741]
MDFLTLQWAYTLTLGFLILSTTLSRLELIGISSLYLDFVYPSLASKNKLLKWRILNGLTLLFSVLTGAFFLGDQLLLFKLFLVLTTITLLVTYLKRKIGKDGADQIRVLSYLALSFCLLIDFETGQLIAVVFLGVQALIAYTTSGLAKVASTHWRKGNVLADILGTYSFGVPGVKPFLKNHPVLEKIASYGAILTMLAVPVCFFIPQPEPLLVALMGMFCFHLATALLMGLNDFLVTFPMTYPGVLILHSFIFSY